MFRQRSDGIRSVWKGSPWLPCCEHTGTGGGRRQRQNTLSEEGVPASLPPVGLGPSCTGASLRGCSSGTHVSRYQGRARLLREQECLCTVSEHTCVHTHPEGRVPLLESCFVSGGLVNSSRSGGVLLGRHVPGVRKCCDGCLF